MNKYLVLGLALCVSAPLYTADFSAAAAAQGQMECQICYDAKAISECVELSCKHAYCKECLNILLQNARTAKNLRELRCPDPSCSLAIEISDVRKITDDHAIEAEIAELATLEMLAKMQGLKQCPTPNCTFAFTNEDNQKEMIRCEGCNATYCSECLVNHRPDAACRYVADAPADRESAEYLMRTTKPCPHCNVRVEKTEGCDHMTCDRCRYEFCWQCGQDWLRGGEYAHWQYCRGFWSDPDPLLQMIEQLPRTASTAPAVANQRNNQRTRPQPARQVADTREDEAFALNLQRQLNRQEVDDLVAQLRERVAQEDAERRAAEERAREQNARRLEVDFARRANEAQRRRQGEQDAEAARRRAEHLARELQVQQRAVQPLSQREASGRFVQIHRAVLDRITQIGSGPQGRQYVDQLRAINQAMKDLQRALDAVQTDAQRRDILNRGNAYLAELRTMAH